MAKRLPAAADNPVAAAIRKAIGAGNTDPVSYTHRPVHRKPGSPKPAKAPADFGEFSALFKLTGKQLTKLGCGNWDGGLFLFPGEWYAHIPKGFPVESINGKIVKFVPGSTPKDLGFGCLAYGVRIGPSKDEDE